MHNYPDGTNTLHPTIAGRPEPVDHRSGLFCHEFLDYAITDPVPGRVYPCRCGLFYEVGETETGLVWNCLGERDELDDEQLARITEG